MLFTIKKILADYKQLCLKMGAGGSSVDPDEFATLKKKVVSLDTSVSSLNTLRTQVDSLASAAAKQISYSDLALSITNNDTNKNALATAIASNPNKLGDALAGSIGTNTTVIQSLQDKLGTNTNFQKAIADTLSSDNYKVKFQGPKGADGNIGDAGALKSNLYDQGRTLWCADGELCSIPAGKKGFNIAPGVGNAQGDIGFKKYSDKLDIVGAQIGDSRWVKVWDSIDTGYVNVGGDIQAGGTIRTGGDNTTFKTIMTSGWDGGSVRSKGTIGVVNDANNDWKAIIDGDNGGRVYAKNRLQIGDWIIYTDGDRLYFWHPRNPGNFVARFSATDQDRLRVFADGDANKGKFFYVNKDKGSGIADIGWKGANPNG